MNKHLLDALEICLKALEKGDTVDSALAKFPHLAADLRPLLEAAQTARTVSLPPVSRTVAASGRARVLAATSRLREKSASPRRMGIVLRVSFAIAVALGFLVLTGAGLGTASARALPGDTLYPIKRIFEDTRLQLAPDPTSQRQLQEEFNQHRVDETHALISEGRVELVEFDGTVTAQTADGWMVAGIPVIVTAQTNVTGTIAIGVEVDVTGQTGSDGKVQAASLVVKDSGNAGEMVSTQTPEETESPESHSPTPQGTATPTPTGNHGSGSGTTRTPKPTDSSGSNGGLSPTTGPTDSSGSQGGGTSIPDSTETPEPTKTPH